MEFVPDRSPHGIDLYTQLLNVVWEIGYKKILRGDTVMPVNIIHTEDGGIIFKCEGSVTGQELKEANQIIYKDQNKIKQISYQIVDALDVSDVSISSAETKEIAELDRQAFKIHPAMIIALVAEKDLFFGLARMWESFATDGPFETMVFRKMEDAQQWIKEELKKRSPSLED